MLFYDNAPPYAANIEMHNSTPALLSRLSNCNLLQSLQNNLTEKKYNKTTTISLLFSYKPKDFYKTVMKLMNYLMEIINNNIIIIMTKSMSIKKF